MTPYVVQKTAVEPEFTGAWDGPVWRQANTLSVANFHPASSEHHPAVEARLLHDDQAIHVHFKVQDHHVRCVHTQPQDKVYEDSCVEFFFQPRPDRGYLNLEANCGGTFLCGYIEDARRIDGAFAKYTAVDPEWLTRIHAYHSLPSPVDPEITTPVEWKLEYSIPLSLVEAYTGPLGALTGQQWRGNFFKCGDKTSHPHWASWAPIGEALNFHQPDRFAPILFA